MNSRSTLLLLAAATLLGAGCASSGRPDGPPTLSSTMFRQMDPRLPRSQARREALLGAELEARRRIRSHVYERRLTDGRTLEDLAVVDPFVRAVIDDTVARARVADRTTTDEGVASVTVRMEWAPVEKMVQEYPQHALR